MKLNLHNYLFEWDRSKITEALPSNFQVYQRNWTSFQNDEHFHIHSKQVLRLEDRSKPKCKLNVYLEKRQRQCKKRNVIRDALKVLSLCTWNVRTLSVF